jgi:hypothetical protein
VATSTISLTTEEKIQTSNKKWVPRKVKLWLYLTSERRSDRFERSYREGEGSRIG